MCGFSGIVNLNNQPVDAELLKSMTDSIRHRGPDDEGYLLFHSGNKKYMQCYGNDTVEELKSKLHPLDNSFNANIGFGFRRLSIIDLSLAGHQPMSNSDNTVWIVFNGEIYNYLELKNELKKLGHKFYSNSDTEVILKAYEQWQENCLSRFNGMWAFVIWDSNQNKFFCSRDRFGIKPFNYYFDGSTFIFSSEVKTILLTDINKELNYEVISKSFSLDSYLINSNSTYFKHISILPHSHYLTINDGEFRLERYYDLPFDKFEKSSFKLNEAAIYYKELFEDAIKLRMRSDVEVGSTLSGGLDSSAIVTLASSYTDRRFRTFSAYFTNMPVYDERKWINIVVDKTNSIPSYISPKPEEVIHDLQKIIWHHDYPLPTSSPVAQYYVMKLSRQNDVSVLLDGQGSDEITGGYSHTFYRYYADLLIKMNLIKFLREYPQYLFINKKGNVFSKLLKTILVLFFNENTLYRNEARRSLNFLNIGEKAKGSFKEIGSIKNVSKLSNLLYNLVMVNSIQTLLHFEDRNSMAHSIESRVPFLDYRLVEFSFSLPSDFKVNSHFGKYIHREALKNIVPYEIMMRRDKVGFIAPGENFWLKNEMKSFFEAVIQSQKFINRGIFNHQMIQSEFNKYLRVNRKMLKNFGRQ